jgi:hypothetical protein
MGSVRVFENLNRTETENSTIKILIFIAKRKITVNIKELITALVNSAFNHTR